MNQYYFAFKVNPIDVMHFNFPRPHSQDYGVICSSYEDAQKWLHDAALVPEHAQDWVYRHYHLPAMNMIITVEPTTMVPKFPQPMAGEVIGVFAHRMQQFQIVGMDLTICQDEVHAEHMVGCSMSGEYTIDSPLLRSASSEMLTRMTDIAEYHQACENHPDIPKEAMQTWAAMMFNNGIHKHRSMQEYFDEFAQCYAREVAAGEEYGPQYGVDVVKLLAAEDAARHLYAEVYDRDIDAFDVILDTVLPETLPYRQEQFMLILQPERYKELLMERVPQDEKEQFSNMWDSKMNDARITNQVTLRTGEMRIQDVSLQVALAVCTEMEYEAFRSQSGTQNIYSQLRTAVTQDEVKLEFFDNPDIDEQEETIEN